jgi:NAD(P)-dependent dehydrogenase (short-subunit alcohol dehydrogenase family)
VADVDRLAAAVHTTIGPVSILVNNAAMIDRSSFLDVSLEQFEAVWHANVRGVFQLSQRIAADMVARGTPGVIVHVSSILARLAVPHRTAYIASKGAIEALTRAMALDLAPHGIRVNAVAPGLIATEALLAGMPDPEVQAAVQSYIPGGRFGRPEELMAAILFAASPEASYLNGAILPVDAGLGGREAGPA